MTDQLAPNERLLKIMEQREMREAAEFQRQEEERREAREGRQMRVNSQKKADAEYWNGLLAWQMKCDHRKGTAGKKKWRHVDYMVSRHIFPNGLTQVKCLKCKMKWYPGDTVQNCAYTMDNYLANKKQPNPTKLSYAQAYQMTLDENTTNTETRSEMVTQGPQPVTA